MQPTLLIVVGLAMIAFTIARMRDGTKSSRFQHLESWQKILGVIAVLMAVMIILTPEFMALGLIGDTAFFDILVLALSFQLHLYVVRAWRFISTVISSTLRLLLLPSLGTSYLLTIAALAIGSAASTIQKTVHRLFS